MVRRITVPLPQKEYSALLELAIAELRNPPNQLRHILRQELQRRGLLLPESDLEGEEQSEAKLATQRTQP